MERRLKRPLTIDDFTVCEINPQAYAAAGSFQALVRELRELKETSSVPLVPREVDLDDARNCPMHGGGA
jgi:hypothetical protein